MFVTLQADNPDLISSVPAMDSLSNWESSERTTEALDVGINVAVEEGRLVSWKWIFHLEKFKPNNMEVTQNLNNPIISFEKMFLYKC